MNSFDHPHAFFPKPSFRAPAQPEILKGAARRALAAFDTGHRFTCAFSPLGAPRLKPAYQTGSGDNRTISNPGCAGAGVRPAQLDRLLESNLLPRFGDEALPESRHDAEFRPELIELATLLVIISAVLMKLFLT